MPHRGRGYKVPEAPFLPPPQVSRTPVGLSRRTRAVADRYNADMEDTGLSEMMELVGFDDADAASLGAIARTIGPSVPRIVRRFYESLFRQSEARAIFGGGEDQLAKLHRFLATWMNELFGGTYDRDYFARRVAIGAAHVREGLPQRYIILGIELIRQELRRELQAAGIADIEDKLLSLDKVLALELAIVLESYEESRAERIRRTERTALEEKLTRAEHLAQIGQMSASLAHEIKNPLAGISGAVQILGDGLDAEDPHRQIVKEILGQIRRLDEAVEDLLMYGRPVTPHVREMSLHDVVLRVLSVLREEPAIQRIRVRYETPVGDSTVRADDNHLEQLLINLIINAAHASADGEVVRIEILPGPDRVELIVIDKGCGMSPSVHQRAFEPFFTTKAKGTGLGLAICRRLIEALGGTLALDTKVDAGTTATASVPRGGPTNNDGSRS